MADVRPDESFGQFIKEQLSGARTPKRNVEEVGTVLQVCDGVARIYRTFQSAGWRVEIEI